jgi:DNA-binding transcriptional LysR family regulator
MDKEIGWELYRTYLSVMQQGSLSGAARALGIAQPTVGRHVEALEKALGLPLFTRSQLGLQPTEAALALRPHAEAMNSHAAALQRTVSSQGAGIQGTVRITASEVVGVEILPPILARLQAQHPTLTVELMLSNAMQDLLQREADIAVRMTAPKQAQLIARRVALLELGLHAHPGYLQSQGMPESLAALGQHRLIGFDIETPFVRAARESLGIPWQREAFRLRCDSDLAQLALIRAGAGIGICQVGLAQREPVLQRVLPEQFSYVLETWVAMHEDLRTSPACKLTFEALCQGLALPVQSPAPRH